MNRNTCEYRSQEQAGGDGMQDYELVLGVDHAALDTGQRVMMQVREKDRLSAAILGEQLLDAMLDSPVEYAHCISSMPIQREAAALSAAA